MKSTKKVGLVNGRKLSINGKVVPPLIRDFILLMEFDLDIERYEQIKFLKLSKDDLAGNYSDSRYFVTYRKVITPVKYWPNIIYEVRSRKDLFSNWKDLKPKIRATRKFAKDHGWKFQLITEQEIRTSYLENVKFLFRYRFLSVNWDDCEFLISKLNELREADPDTLVKACYKHPISQAKLIPTLWHLISIYVINRAYA